MRNVFMVAEKPSLAQSLARILSNGQVNSRKGFNGACSIHEYNARFPPTGENVHFKFTSVCGHVMSLDFIGRYNNWDKVDPAGSVISQLEEQNINSIKTEIRFLDAHIPADSLRESGVAALKVELFEATAQKKEASANLRMVSFLEKEARGCDYLVLWLDCDKEGENICFEVIDAVANSMNRPRGNEQTIFRAKFSAITDADVKKAMNTLGRPNKDEAMSVDARQELDLRVGCAFTRYQTKFFQGKYGDLDSTLISFGPCQTPTLGFCVERHDKIQSFKPEAFWVICLQVAHPAGSKVKLDWSRVRLFDREVSQMFLNMLKGVSVAKVLSVQEKEKAKARPGALNTVEMLRVASSGLGMSPHHTMQIAERLYVQGYISYPRTETTDYPSNFDLKGTLKQQANSPDWGHLVRELLAEGIQKPKKGHDAGDHPPITPMRAATESELGHEAWRLYDFITRHFIASLSHDCRYLQTTVTFEVGQERFQCVGKKIIDLGYTAVLSWQAIPLDESIPAFKVGDVCDITEVKLGERETSPPDFLTESELITLMEKHGIGTDASIPVHINNICERNYVTVGSGRRLIPTTLGVVLVHGYQKIDIDLVKPTMRAAVEQQLNLIAHGQANFSEVLNHAIGIFQSKFKYFVETITAMDELFEVSFSPLASTGRPLSRCGKCRHYMKFVQAKPSRLHCASCDDTYTLPQNGNIKLYKELRCPLDHFELVLWTTGAQGKSYALCPYCYNKPPFGDMRKGMGCNECTHPTCIHAMTQNSVSSCVECENGLLVLDQASAPKWRIACNKCNVVINLLENANKVTIADTSCEECQSAILDVVFNKNKSPLANGETERSGCVFCDAVLRPLVQMKHARYRRSNAGRSRGGRGRGGRGGGRGKPPKDKMSQLAAYFV